METRDILSGAKSFHKIYNQVIQTAAARHHLSLMDADIILFLYNNPDYDTAKDISYFRMLAKSGVSASVESRQRRIGLHLRKTQKPRYPNRYRDDGRCLNLHPDWKLHLLPGSQSRHGERIRLPHHASGH